MSETLAATVVKAMLEDGRPIALVLPAESASAIVERLVKNAGGAPRDKKPNHAPEQRPELARIQTYLDRMGICSACPKARDENGWTICSLCGCPMNHLNLLANMKCKDQSNPKFGREAEVT